jgi:hypothetical protein
MIVEATKDEILSNYGGPVSKVTNIDIRLFQVNPKTKTLVFKVADRGPNGSGRTHLSTIRMIDHRYLTKDDDLSHRDRVDLAFNDGNLLVYCSCESYLYGGFQYIDWVLDYGIRKELRRPVRNNPREVGSVCKHLYGVLSDFNYWIPQVADIFANAKANNYRVVTL